MVNMNDQQLDDLKQFIDSRISQSEGRLRSEIRESEDRVKSELRGEIQELRTEVRDGFTAVGEAVTRIHDQLDDHEDRVTRLESATA